MNKLLSIDLIYDVFSHGAFLGVSPTNYFNTLLKNEEFNKLINIKPNDYSSIEKILLKSKRSKEIPNENKLRYLAFLLVTMLIETSIPLQKIGQYINPQDIFDNFDYYHSNDEKNVIFELMVRRNEKYKNIGLEFDLEDDLMLTKYNLLALFPFNRFKDFKIVFESKLDITVFYLKEGEILFATDDLKTLVSDNYFKNKYLIGNIAYCFGYKESNLPLSEYPTAINHFLIKENHLLFTDSKGVKHIFKR